MTIQKWLAAVAAVLLLGSCATGYQPRSLSGGYQERQLSDSRWYVEFFGNGHTRRDTVFGFFLHRCAELTVQKGFDYFVLISKEPNAAQNETGVVHAAGRAVAPTYIYVPSHSVTTWSARGTIEMRRGQADPRDPREQDARDLLARLAPYMQQAREKGNMTLPEDLLAGTEDADRPRPANSAVRLEDLDALLPQKKP